LRLETHGRVVESLVRANDWVNAGDLLLRLDDRRQRQQVAAGQASLELAEAQLDRLINGPRESERAEARAMYDAQHSRLQQAANSLRRISELRRQEAVSQQEADDHQSGVDVLTAEVNAARARVEQLAAPARTDEIREAQARVATAEAELEMAKVLLDMMELRAPANGRVLEVNAEAGEILGPDATLPAIVLADTSELRIRAYVEELDAPRLTVGMKASITADGIAGRVFTGRIIELSPRMTRKQMTTGRPDEVFDTRMREVLVAVEASSGLLIDLRVDVEFLVSE
jgi:multidrug resistance efflux pump